MSDPEHYRKSFQHVLFKKITHIRINAFTLKKLLHYTWQLMAQSSCENFLCNRQMLLRLTKQHSVRIIN